MTKLQKIAIMARVADKKWVDKERSTIYVLEPVVPREDLRLNLCDQHPRLVYFDGPTCPCCEQIAQYFRPKVTGA